MEISFGRKIPIMNSRVYDKQAGEFVKATVYELDGKDEDDYLYVAMKGDCIPYKTDITSSLYLKYRKQQKTAFEPNSQDNFEKFYALETEDGKISALIEAFKIKNFADIKRMSTDRSGKYGLLGQTIMASLMQQMLLEKDPTLIVSDPSTKGRDFYTNTCGFKSDAQDSHQVVINKEDMTNFLRNYSQKTEQETLDFIA